MNLNKIIVSGVLFALTPALSQAQPADTLNQGDTAWILVSTALVLFMTLPGLALFYGGLVRTKNALSVLMQCFAITCLASVIWLTVGYSLAFSDGGSLNAWIGGLDNFLFASIQEDTLSGSIPESLFALFQMTFVIITPALIIGAFAERIKFSAVLFFTTLWILTVYAPVCHWIWGGGWLSNMGMLDFAGGAVVHITAGIGALVAAIYLGKRIGFGRRDIAPHNLTMTVTGAGMLWVGWFGFNGGSALAANGDAAMAMLVTHISASVAALTWMFLDWNKNGKPSVLGIVTGMVAGLGTITPASGFVGPGGALVIGLLAGVICFYAVSFIKEKLLIDDSLDVFPVHGVGGILGTLVTAIFASDALGVFSGQGYSEGMTMGSQLVVQFIGVFATIIYTGIITFGILKITDILLGLRVEVTHEDEGLDHHFHNEQAYDLGGLVEVHTMRNPEDRRVEVLN